MDTQEFLEKLLPSTGVRFLAKRIDKPDHPAGGYFIHTPFGAGDSEGMADAALAMSANGENVFFALSSFKEVIYKVNGAGREYPAGRQQDNTLYTKALWLDLDVGKADAAKSYPSKRDAAQDVARLCQTVGLPQPMLVSSGAGLHVYWPLTKAVPSDQWTKIALMLRAVCDHMGIRHDPACTSDVARVLRPIGTMNPKHGKPVTLLKDAAAVPVTDLATALSDFIQRNAVKVRKASGPKPAPGSANAALMGGIEYPPSHAEVIAEHCNVIRRFRDTAGAVGEPVWYASLGLLKHTVEGEAVCHRWSEGHPDYDYDQCQAKVDQWTQGPTTCEKFRQEAPELCHGCAQTCKSPIQLGHTLTPATLVVAAANAPAPILPLCPAGFRWNGHALIREIPNKDGVVEDHVFSKVLFYPINRLRGEDGTWNLRMIMNTGHGWREFDLPQMLIPDPRGLARHLAKYEIIIPGIQHAMDYLSQYVQSLMEHNYQVATYSRFGWDETGSFVVGNTAFKTDGTTETVLVSDNVVQSGKALDCTPAGDLQQWIELVDAAYNRPGAEKYQFAFAAAFASPLVPLFNFDDYRGIPIVLSGEGGIGKSSVCMAASTIYARPKGLMVDANSEGGATLNSLFGLASMFNGVPLLFDEMTERDPKDFVPLMYTLSNGICKARMQANGQFAKTPPPFAGIYYGTSNKNITDMLYEATKKDVSDAASARCFEIGGLTKDDTLAIFRGVNMKETLGELYQHTGVAGQVYLPYVSIHRDKLRASVARLKNNLGSRAESDSRERFYTDTVAFVHIAAKVASDLGLIRWDVNAMTKWALEHIKTLRRSFIERAATADDNMSLFLSWLHGHIVYTKRYPLGRGRPGEVEALLEPLRDKPFARVATEDRRMIVSVQALADWCNEYNQVLEHIRDQFKRDNYILRDSRDRLGKGTSIITGRGRAYELNYDKVVGSLHLVKTADSEEPAETATV